MSRKTIIFILGALPCGGVERSFLSYLSLFDNSRWDVTVLLIEKTGEWLGELPPWVRVEEVRYQKDDERDLLLGRTAMFVSALKRLDFGRLFYLVVRYLKPQNRKNGLGFVNSFQMESVARGRGLYPKDFRFEYDVVVAYGCYCYSALVAKGLLFGRKKIVWFHSEDQFRCDGKGYLKYLYSWFDHRYCASNALASAHNRDYADGAELFEHFPHYLNVDWYRQRAEVGAGFEDGYNGLRIVTCGRLSCQKGVDLAVESLAELRKRGFEVRWYWVGGGEDEKMYRDIASSLGVGADFVMLGVKNNPYPYIAQCDIYVQPSRFEGFCLTVAEARAFARPIVATDFAGAREQLRHGETGLIVDSATPTGIAQAVRRLVESPAMRQRLSENLAAEIIGNRAEVESRWSEAMGVPL